jgi:hypothetical protein
LHILRPERFWYSTVWRELLLLEEELLFQEVYFYGIEIYRGENYFFSEKELLFMRQGTTFCLEGEGQTEMTVTQAEQPWSALLLLSVVVWGRTRDLLLLMLLLRWWCGISSYSLSLSTPLSVRSAKQQHGFTNSAISPPVGGFMNY